MKNSDFKILGDLHAQGHRRQTVQLALQLWGLSDSRAYAVPTTLPCCLQRELEQSPRTCIFQIFLTAVGEKELISWKLKWSKGNLIKCGVFLYDHSLLDAQSSAPWLWRLLSLHLEWWRPILSLLVPQRKRIHIISIPQAIKRNSFDEQLFIRITIKLSTYCNI